MIEKTGDDLVVIADNPAEMVEAQQATICVIQTKLMHAESDLADARATLQHLTDANMETATAQRLVKRAESRQLFLSKAKEALEAGYVIVPEMPHNVVAIRVKRPPRHEVVSVEGNYTPMIQERSPEVLPAGEGNYVDPMPETETSTHKSILDRDKLKIHTTRRTTGAWDTNVELPVEFLRPTVVQRTGTTMMRKLFDEIAVVGASTSFQDARRKADPMVVGSVIDKVAKRRLWFLVAWFVDTRTI